MERTLCKANVTFFRSAFTCTERSPAERGGVECMKEILNQKLANPSQTPYSKGVPRFNRGGDIFMEGKLDMLPNSQPTNPEHAEKVPLKQQEIARINWGKINTGRVLLPDEQWTQEELIKRGASPVSGGAQEPNEPPAPPTTPPEEPNNQKENRLDSTDYDTTGVTDSDLKRIGDRIGIRLERNLMDYREVERNIQDMEGALKNLPVDSPDLVWARNLYNKLYDEVARQRELAGEVNWEQVREALRIATKGGDLKAIEDIVRENYDFNERINVRDLVEVSLSKDAIEGNTYGYALEYVLESIINVADLTPLGTIPNPTFVQSENISRLIKGTLDLDQDEYKDFYKYLKELQERRQLSHELYKSMSTRGAYEKYVGEHLKNDGFHYLENEIVGVSETQGLWEKVMARKKGKKKQILSQAEFDDVHKEVRRLFEKNANLDASGTSQKLKKRLTIHKSGQEPLGIERPLRKWEIDRAAVVGRSVAHVSGRAITYGMIGDLPTIDDELYDSMNAEYPARIEGSMQVTAKRFLGSSASKEYISSWVKNKLQIARESGLVFGEGDEKEGRSLYGQRLDSAVYLDTGVPDLKSHGWRNRRTQLKHSKFAKIAEHDSNDPSKNTIGDYLDREWKNVDDEMKDPKGKALKGKDLDDAIDKYLAGERKKVDDLRQMSLVGVSKVADVLKAEERLTREKEYLENKEAIRISKEERIKNILYSNNVRGTVLQQRLYLSALLREVHFTPMLKEEIWKKVAEFLPSRIAAFFPEERKSLTKSNGAQMREDDVVDEWRDLSDKLFMAEMDRVRKQAEKVKNNDFTEVKLSDCYEDNGITTQGEKDYIKAIVELGRNKSKMLSNMVFPQSAFLDDAPEPEWMNLGKETVGRLLVNDYEGYNTANNERNAIIANPSMRPAESAEHLVKAKDGYASPIGVESAQDRLEADVQTRYDLYGMDTSSKWGLYSINRWLRKPTSLIEKSNVDANISMDEKVISQDVDFLSQHSVVNNDRAKLDFLGHTQSERIKKRAKARLRDLWIRNLRIFLMLFPLAFSTEFIKMIAPDFVKEK